MLLAADRVYLAAHVTMGTGGLLHHPFTLTCPYFLSAYKAIVSPKGSPPFSKACIINTQEVWAGGLLSVALALRLLWPSVRWSPLLHAARTFLSRHNATSNYLSLL